MITTRRKPARTFSPAVDGLETRKLLSTVSAPIKHAPAFVTQDIKKMGPVAEVQRYRPGNNGVSAAIRGGHVGTNLLTAPIKQDLNPQPLPPGVMRERSWW